ncbi:hypothetical protein A1O3_09343 [Capronia epimyces CBS 606.96]|uniref:DNA mismatch repair protein S5 domain-containing protein n=1 Tax=Capronia epimyces CBS 606.96 TaxID=1182542 RepID=W9XCG3_9EURO|nr:uncharacterized protein A1O3_09343 [Capronia epimyces CBS 606.96]EXJ78182.1 hypothetical protein A1O3_09343 [Capronia epimyces CBS 606.96]
MPISALPEATSRALGSSLVLNDAKSVVKELVDNALDARASAISIEISANTLDVIQVKDNGTAIGIEDRQLLCRRGCTSKIRSMDDLARLGGTFLGFRGEALASMAELSQAVVVTTRVDGEIVATSLKYGASGLLSSSSASHPVGTTMRVQQFLSNIPVRKQTALKNSARTLQAIRAALFQFAFARPDVRFSFKVLKGKNDKLNWTYAASSNDSLLEVGAKIVGKDLVSQCTASSISSADPEIEMEDGWEIDALLVSLDTEKVRGGNQYISIDGRPVSSDRGTMKEIITTYKRYLQHALDRSDTSPISRPFLAMQIRCPPETYDVNIEPAKDEVLFFRPYLLLSLVESLFQKVYGVLNDETHTPEKPRRNPEPAPKVDGNMYEADPHGFEFPETLKQRTHGSIKSDQAEETFERKQSFLNPFTIAAMNAIVAPKKMGPIERGTSSDLDSVTTPGHELKGSSCEPQRTVAISHQTPLGPPRHLPSPSTFESSPIRYQNPSPPMRPRVEATLHARGGTTRSPDEKHDVHALQPKTTALQAWLTPDSETRPPCRDRVCQPVLNRPAENPPRDLPSDLPSSPTEPERRSIQPTTISYGGLKWGAGQRPFKSPLKSLGHSHPSQASRGLPEVRPNAPDQGRQPDGQDTDVTSGLSEEGGWDRGPDGHGQLSRHPSLNQAVILDSATELSDIMDFEHRKKAAIAHQRRLAASFPPGAPMEKPTRRRPSHVHGLTPSTAECASVSQLEDEDEDENEDYAGKFSGVEAPARNGARSNPHQNRYQAALRNLSHSRPRVLLAGAAERHSDSNSHHSESVAPESEPEREREDESDRLPLSKDDPRAYLIRHRRKVESGDSKLYRTQLSRLPLESIPSGTTTVHLKLETDAFADMAALTKQLQGHAASDRYVTHGEVEGPDLFETPIFMSSDWQYILRDLVKTKYRFEAEDGRALVPHLKVEISQTRIC